MNFSSVDVIWTLLGAALVVAAQKFCQNFSKLLTKLFGKYFRYL